MGCVPSSVQTQKPVVTQQSAADQVTGADMGPLTDASRSNDEKLPNVNLQELLVNSPKVSLMRIVAEV